MDANERILVLGVSFHATLESRLEQLVLWLMPWLLRVGAASDRGAVPCTGLPMLDDSMAEMAGFPIATDAASGS